MSRDNLISIAIFRLLYLQLLCTHYCRNYLPANHVDAMLFDCPRFCLYLITPVFHVALFNYLIYLIPRKLPNFRIKQLFSIITENYDLKFIIACAFWVAASVTSNIKDHFVNNPHLVVNIQWPYWLQQRLVLVFLLLQRALFYLNLG